MKKAIWFAVAFCLLVSSPGLALAQDAEEIYFSGQQWDVPRAKWGEFKAYFDKYEKAVMEKLLADGLIVEWALAAEGLHSPDGYSHSTWFGARSIADLEKVFDAYQEILGKATAGEGDALLAKLVTKHEDHVLRSAFYANRPVSITKGYLLGSSWQVKTGKGSDFQKSWEARQKPVWDKLLADGVIASYSLETEHFHTDKPGRWSIYYAIDDMAKDEAVSAAFEAAQEGVSETERTARRAFFMDIIEPGEHRDTFDRLIYFQTK